MFTLLGGDPNNCPRATLPVTEVATGKDVRLLLPLVAYLDTAWAIFPNGNVMSIGPFPQGPAGTSNLQEVLPYMLKQRGFD